MNFVVELCIVVILKKRAIRNVCLCTLRFGIYIFAYFGLFILLFSVGSWRCSSRLQRAFVPHSPMDLQIGHRVRVLLPTGRISTGTLRYLGQPHGSPDFYLGVELELAENVKEVGTYKGQHYFDW